jgi:IS5 family transposase
LIDWDFFEREWAGFFPSEAGRPATPSRLVAGLLYLQHAFKLSDEAVVARWVENPYYQHFCGETFFQHRPPIDPSSLTRWRNRIGEEGAEWLLTKTIEAGRASGAVDDKSLERVSVDTTVMEKNIAYPTDARLYERARQKLVALAREAGVELRQSYTRLAPRLARQVGRYAHARQFKRMRKALRTLKGYTRTGHARSAPPSARNSRGRAARGNLRRAGADGAASGSEAERQEQDLQSARAQG